MRERKVSKKIGVVSHFSKVNVSNAVSKDIAQPIVATAPALDELKPTTVASVTANPVEINTATVATATPLPPTGHVTTTTAAQTNVATTAAKTGTSLGIVLQQKKNAKLADVSDTTPTSANAKHPQHVAPTTPATTAVEPGTSQKTVVRTVIVTRPPLTVRRKTAVASHVSTAAGKVTSPAAATTQSQFARNKPPGLRQLV